MGKPKAAPAAPPLKRFAIYRQLPPKGDHLCWIANFQLAGHIEAANGAQAIDKARAAGMSAPVVCAA